MKLGNAAKALRERAIRAARKALALRGEVLRSQALRESHDKASAEDAGRLKDMRIAVELHK